ncbi:MAG TPA: nuclear transport factor 2 family protein [Novosphingobium sp.]|nr:nuclear transport factor 2 family protein [Novosphingobium sp.]HMP55129.1 nuclear transport factor 2 family protein [Novosphingobium sp.]
MTAADRLDRIESRAAIAELVHAYARAVRHGRVDEAASLFVEDGWFETREGPAGGETTLRMRVEGREHFRVFLASTMQSGRPSVSPLIHNLIVEFDGDDSARGNAMLETVMVATGKRTLGEYHDVFHRVDGRWLFAGRTFTIQLSV